MEFAPGRLGRLAVRTVEPRRWLILVVSVPILHAACGGRHTTWVAGDAGAGDDGGGDRGEDADGLPVLDADEEPWVAPPTTTWIQIFTGDSMSSFESVAVRDDGTIAAFGYSTLGDWLAALAPDGEVLWQRVLRFEDPEVYDPHTRLALGADGDLYLVGRGWDDDLGATYNWIAKTDRDGAVQWARRGGDDDRPWTRVLGTVDGGAVVTTPDPAVRDSWGIRVIRLDAGGEVLWQRSITSPRESVIATARRNAAAELDAGRLVVVGTVTVPDGAHADILVVALSPDGDLEWRTCLGAPGAEPASVTRAGSGVIVTGWGGQWGVIARLDSSGGVGWLRGAGVHGYPHEGIVHREGLGAYLVGTSVTHFGEDGSILREALVERSSASHGVALDEDAVVVVGYAVEPHAGRRGLVTRLRLDLGTSADCDDVAPVSREPPVPELATGACPQIVVTDTAPELVPLDAWTEEVSISSEFLCAPSE